MKKRTVIFILSAVIILAACAEIADTNQAIALPVRVDARLSGSAASFTACVTENECIITFGGGHSLAGTELRFDSSGGKATVGGFTRDVDISIFPAQAALIKALRTVCADPDSGVETDNGTKYTIDEMTIMVYYDKDTEEIVGIGTEESGRRFDFVIAALEPYEIQSNSQDRS